MSSGNWTWVGGSSVVNQYGSYSGDNAWPGARYSAAMWATDSSSIYLFGGTGCAGGSKYYLKI